MPQEPSTKAAAEVFQFHHSHTGRFAVSTPDLMRKALLIFAESRASVNVISTQVGLNLSLTGLVGRMVRVDYLRLRVAAIQR